MAIRVIPEQNIENEILLWLNMSGIFAWKVKTVGVFDPVKKIYRRSNNRYHIKGVSDVLGILPDGKLLAIEVKSKAGRASPEQIQFIDKIKASGGVALIARSLEEVIETVRPYLT